MTRLQEVQDVARVALQRQTRLLDVQDGLLHVAWVALGVMLAGVAVEGGLAASKVWWVGVGLWCGAICAWLWTRHKMEEVGRLMAALEEEWEREERA